MRPTVTIFLISSVGWQKPFRPSRKCTDRTLKCCVEEGVLKDHIWGEKLHGQSWRFRTVTFARINDRHYDLVHQGLPQRSWGPPTRATCAPTGAVSRGEGPHKAQRVQVAHEADHSVIEDCFTRICGCRPAKIDYGKSCHSKGRSKAACENCIEWLALNIHTPKEGQGLRGNVSAHPIRFACKVYRGCIHRCCFQRESLT